ncbi:M14 family zinc carboxypeptidase [Dokdonella koreensis]|uniref:Peptidase M14, carboxypeptidase A n=1 Tax=Dokdonella koreensis DS-123 TaxID=1300342 RepID=A0A161HRQ6_9GAMM|nr:M14 family zinc carboxypeptidase [Dokdonella koreensis]ANB19272.1 Peptidase M14, carboxypeptidase A [Dokdonella koreensis DS-123]
MPAAAGLRSRRCLAPVLAAALGWPLAVPAASWIAEIDYADDAERDRLATEFGHPAVDPLRRRVTAVADGATLARLGAAGFAVRIDAVASARLQDLERHGAAESIPGYACYRTVEESEARMQQLAATYPALASVVEIGPSWRRTQDPGAGHALKVLRLTQAATAGTFPDKPALFVLGGIHAREYVTAEAALRFGEWLATGYGRDADATTLLDHYQIHLLVQANPDGRKIAETGVLWRKNADDAFGACTAQPPTGSYHAGVDLNRNYPFNWNAGGASADPCTQTFRGPAAASEPETQAVMAYVAGVQASAGAPYAGGLFADRRLDDRTTPAADTVTGVVLDLHSNGRLVLWPWGDTATPAPNAPQLTTFARRIGWHNGYLPIVSNGIGATSGTTPDTAYGALGVAAYTIELGGLDFFQDCAAFEDDTWPKNLAGLRYIARNLAAPYRLPAGPDVAEVRVEPNLILAGETARIRARADDGGYNVYGAAQPVFAITAASASIDALPWHAASSLPLTADDGAFDQAAEAVSAPVSAAALGAGRHPVHVQARNAAGADGPPASAFVEVAAAGTVATVAGTVTDRTTGLPLAAGVRLVESDGDVRALPAASDGSYRLHAHPGSAVLEARRFGYLTERIENLALVAGATRTRDIALSPQCNAFADDVEAGNAGWTPQPATGGWGIEPTVTGQHVWNDSPGGRYPSSTDLRLVSPALDLSGYAAVSLAFDERCYTEETYDTGVVEVSTDAAHAVWSEVYRCSGRAQWRRVTLDLPQLAGQGSVQLRLRTRSDASGEFDGWSVDNLTVGLPDAQCRAGVDPLFDDGFEP